MRKEKSKKIKKKSKIPHMKQLNSSALWPNSKGNLSQDSVRDMINFFSLCSLTAETVRSKILLLGKSEISNTVHRKIGKY